MEGADRAQAEFQAFVGRKVVDVAEAELADVKYFTRLWGSILEQFVFRDVLEAGKERVNFAEAHGGFQEQGVEGMAGFVVVSAEGEGGLPVVVVAEGAVVGDRKR